MHFPGLYRCNICTCDSFKTL